MDVIDLDVFVPEPKPTKFTDKEGFELKRQKRALEIELDSMRSGDSFFARAFSKRKALVAKIKKIDNKIKSHTHTVDVSSASVASSMYVLKHIDEFKRLEKLSTDQVTDKEYRLIMGIVADACSRDGQKMSVDYLMKNMYVAQGLELMKNVMQSLLEYLATNFFPAAGAETEK